MKRFTLSQFPDGEPRLPDCLLRSRRITGGGIYCFRPGECAHPEPHCHDTDEVFIVLQGKGVMPVDGRQHPMAQGDVIIIEAGEDHHTTSSVDAPLMVSWFLLERSGPDSK